MASFKSLGDAAKPYGVLAEGLKGRALEPTNTEVGRAAKKIAANAASADLGGDPKFSGWAPKLDTQYRSLRGRSQGVVIMPTRSSAGPWTVAETGRNQGETGAFVGPGVNRKTGTTARSKSGAVRRVRATKAKRWNGTTKGKNTATDAVREFERQIPQIVRKGILALNRKVLGG